MKASNQGVAGASHLLGLMYYEGDGVKRDTAKAYRWFLMAADGNCAEAQYTLGEMFYVGAVVPRDMKKAKEWTRRAHENSFAAAARRWKEWELWKY